MANGEEGNVSLQARSYTKTSMCKDYWNTKITLFSHTTTPSGYEPDGDGDTIIAKAKEIKYT